MIFPQALQSAILLQRYQRFLADVRLADGQIKTLHCPKTGSMLNCQAPGSKVWFTDSGNSKRKYPCTWQLVENSAGQLVGVNTGLANQLTVAAIQTGVVTELAGYAKLATEVAYGEQGSRIDILLSNSGQAGAPAAECFVEVKNVSLAVGPQRAIFPDAVTLRGQKHLQELMLMRKQGHRAVLLFCVQISGIQAVAPADAIDPVYGKMLREAVAQGVEVLAYRAEFDIPNSGITLSTGIAVDLV